MLGLVVAQRVVVVGVVLLERERREPRVLRGRDVARGLRAVLGIFTGGLFPGVMATIALRSPASRRGWIFGVMGDRYGRTRSLGCSVLCYCLFTGIGYFARTPLELLVLRFLACQGIGGAWPNTVALVAEAWPTASRPFLAGLLGTAANVGQEGS